MSIAGDRTIPDYTAEAGIFSTISVPTPTVPPVEPASTPSIGQDGTGQGTPLLDGVIQGVSSDIGGLGGSQAVSESSASLGGLGGTSNVGRSTVISGSSIISAAQSSATISTSTSTLDQAEPSTIFTTIPASSTAGPIATPPVISEPVTMINTANILLPANKLFPLGIVVVVLGALIAAVLATLFFCKYRKHRRQRKLGDRILSFSPDISNAPYPFDAKAYNDDVESRYPAMPDRVAINDPTNYGASPPRPATFGIASSFPSQFEDEANRRRNDSTGQRSYYTETTRVGSIHDRPDTFTCAMFPAGNCPREYEEAVAQATAAAANTSLERQRSGSPVPSFHTGRLDQHQQPDISAQMNQAPRKLLTPPLQPKYKSKHIPAPLMISPSINEGTNSVRGFTPRVSVISAGSAYTAM